jgi:hypothetical protein
MATRQQTKPGTNGHAPKNRLAGKIPAAPSETAPNGTAAVPRAPAGEDRGSNGKFLPGNKAARGNPFARKMAAMRSALLSTATELGIQTLGVRLLADAIAGNLAAAQLYLSYCVGRPANVVDPDELDLHELRLLQARPGMKEVLSMLLKISPGVAAELLGNAGPKTVDALLDAVKKANDADRRELVERLWDRGIDPEDLGIDDDFDDDTE